MILLFYIGWHEIFINSKFVFVFIAWTNGFSFLLFHALFNFYGWIESEKPDGASISDSLPNGPPFHRGKSLPHASQSQNSNDDDIHGREFAGKIIRAEQIEMSEHRGFGEGCWQIVVNRNYAKRKRFSHVNNLSLEKRSRSSGLQSRNRNFVWQTGLGSQHLTWKSFHFDPYSLFVALWHDSLGLGRCRDESGKQIEIGHLGPNYGGIFLMNYVLIRSKTNEKTFNCEEENARV